MKTNKLSSPLFFLLTALLSACSAGETSDAPCTIIETALKRDSVKCSINIQLPENLAHAQPLMEHIAGKIHQNKVHLLSADTILILDTVLQYLALGENNRDYEFSHFILSFLKGDWLYENGSATEARQYIRQSLDILEQQQDNWQDTCNWVLQAAVLNRASLLYANLNDRDNGLAYSKASIRINEMLGFQGEIASGYANIGFTLQSAGEPFGALEAHQRALCIYNNMPELTDADSLNRAWTYNNLAFTCSIFADSLEVRSQFAGAEAYRKKSLRQYKINLSLPGESAETDEFQFFLLYTTFNIAYMYTKMPSAESADSIRWYIKQVRSFWTSPEEIDSLYQAIIFRHLAYADAYEGKWEESLTKIEQALYLLKKGTTKDGRLLIENKGEYLNILLSKAYLLNVFAAQQQEPGPWAQSLNTYLQAFKFMEELRKELTTDASLESIIKPRLKHYSDAFEVARHLYHIQPKHEYLEAAFEILERSKGFTLEQSIYRKLEQLEENSSGPDFLQQELAYRRMIHELESALIKERSEKTEKDLRATRERFSRFIDSLKNSNAPRAQAFYHNRIKEELPSITEVQRQILDDKTAVVSYLLGSRRLSALLITKDSAVIVNASIDSTFFMLLEDFQNSLESEREYVHYTRKAQALYKVAIKMLDPYLSQTLNQLIVIPDKQLSRVPFGALLADAPKEKNPYNELQYFAGRYFLAYHSSLNGLLSSRKLEHQRHIASQPFGGFIANMPDQDANLTSCSDFELEALNAQVKHTHAKYFSLQSLPPFEQASKSVFIRQAENFDLLQLSLHGCSESQGNRSFYLEFHPASEDDDGILSLPEIYNLNFNARMAILSNCRTAEGAYIYGEGVMSISRAFNYAGCTRIIATANPVLSKATADVLTLFYEEWLEKGLPPHQALATAQRQYYQTRDVHPRNWSNLLYIGDILPLTSVQIGSNLRQ